ncbi:MAG TPA: prepilin-type N-terminal cleavage/methylation domain-containing protein [Candidatus Saccharimonas sp.]|jgi:prepilin-type N-terminal cleavage/methylation domain-containing protein|nr:prepilin-type N-terminal cleavage/methylation domain-containing protein [Candidatus Saccharimonas sp.]
MSSVKKTRGFTLIELVVVIVVIAIIAGIVLVSFRGIQSRARDDRRLADMSVIVKSLDAYKSFNQSYPAVIASGLGLQSSWESSARETSGEFLAPLESIASQTSMPVDPINNANGNDINIDRTNGKFTYVYNYYAAGTNGCDIARGNYYVVGVLRTDTAGSAKISGSPGFSCSSRDWQTELSWVTGRFEK